MEALLRLHNSSLNRGERKDYWLNAEQLPSERSVFCKSVQEKQRFSLNKVHSRFAENRTIEYKMIYLASFHYCTEPPLKSHHSRNFKFKSEMLTFLWRGLYIYINLYTVFYYYIHFLYYICIDLYLSCKISLILTASL